MKDCTVGKILVQPTVAQLNSLDSSSFDGYGFFSLLGINIIDFCFPRWSQSL